MGNFVITYSESDKLEIFNGLFKGRSDVFAVRWEKGAKAGYMPAYHYDPYMYRRHKRNGGTFKTYKDKSYIPLKGIEVLKHLNGEHHIGIYPLLQDNTSWFIAADFDGKNWEGECKKVMGLCKSKNIPSYLERSRSGNGGHIWIFFASPYPARKSRKLLVHLLKESQSISEFDKFSSFDRLFPNQDYLSGKGLGNLIALPLNQAVLEKGNGGFLNDNMEPYQDQWTFLKSVKKISVDRLDALYDQLILVAHGSSPSDFNTSKKLLIKLSNNIRLNKSAITIELTDFLKEELNFSNSAYFVKKKVGRSTHGTPSHFRLIDETENEVVIPRGIMGRLARFCTAHNIPFEFKDERKLQQTISFNTTFRLREHQEKTVCAAEKKQFGIIVAPPGTGKTIIGLQIIANKKQPTLIIVHRKQLMAQWLERIQSFMGLRKAEIGRIGQGRAKIGKKVTVAMFQSLAKFLDKPESSEYYDAFGTVIIDECHHISAESFRNSLSKLSTFYLYGLTATPFRKGNDGRLIFIYLGDVIASIDPKETKNYRPATVKVRKTALQVPFNPKTDSFETLSKILVNDSARNQLIIKDVIKEVNEGGSVVIITERREHIATLNHYLKGVFEVITLSGEDNERSRKGKWGQISRGDFQVLITTGQLMGEGVDLNNISRLFLVYPFSFKGKLIQYIGRVQRSELAPVIYDYRDYLVDYLDRLFLKRNTYYRKLKKEADLFMDLSESGEMSAVTIDKTVKIALDKLDFRYGSIAFNYPVQELNTEIEFELENEYVRPEIEVLKPYFSKSLKMKYANVEIFAEFENGMLVTQRAESEDLGKINQDTIESVRFQFAIDEIKNDPNHQNDNRATSDLEGLRKSNQFPGSHFTEEQLINNLIGDEKYRHFRQLRYLASKHEGSLLKIRFILKPFSFVFLLKGKKFHHIILETLDTEEATYIWHTEIMVNGGEISKLMVWKRLDEIESDLQFIKDKGRQAFILSSPESFSRLNHDYSDPRKGYILWKGQLEERLV